MFSVGTVYSPSFLLLPYLYLFWSAARSHQRTALISTLFFFGKEEERVVGFLLLSQTCMSLIDFLWTKSSVLTEFDDIIVSLLFELKRDHDNDS